MRPTALEQDGYKLKEFKDLYLNPRPDSGLGISKCAEFTRGQGFNALWAGSITTKHSPQIDSGPGSRIYVPSQQKHGQRASLCQLSRARL